MMAFTRSSPVRKQRGRRATQHGSGQGPGASATQLQARSAAPSSEACAAWVACTGVVTAVQPRRCFGNHPRQPDACGHRGSASQALLHDPARQGPSRRQATRAAPPQGPQPPPPCDEPQPAHAPWPAQQRRQAGHLLGNAAAQPGWWCWPLLASPSAPGWQGCSPMHLPSWLSLACLKCIPCTASPPPTLPSVPRDAPPGTATRAALPPPAWPGWPCVPPRRTAWSGRHT